MERSSHSIKSVAYCNAHDALHSSVAVLHTSYNLKDAVYHDLPSRTFALPPLTLPAFPLPAPAESFSSSCPSPGLTGMASGSLADGVSPPTSSGGAYACSAALPRSTSSCLRSAPGRETKHLCSLPGDLFRYCDPLVPTAVPIECFANDAQAACMHAIFNMLYMYLLMPLVDDLANHSASDLSSTCDPLHAEDMEHSVVSDQETLPMLHLAAHCIPEKSIIPGDNPALYCSPIVTSFSGQSIMPGDNPALYRKYVYRLAACTQTPIAGSVAHAACDSSGNFAFNIYVAPAAPGLPSMKFAFRPSCAYLPGNHFSSATFQSFDHCLAMWASGPPAMRRAGGNSLSTLTGTTCSVICRDLSGSL